jgi:hypothetical protein
MFLKCGYAKSTEIKEFRAMTVGEAMNLYDGQTVYFIDRFGQYRNARVNSTPKRWKTRPTHVSIAFKYGMYEHFREESFGNSLSEDFGRIIVPVE